MSDDADQRRIDRREALKKVAAVGGALWVVPTVQSLNMTKAWAAVGSDPGTLPGGGDDPGGEGDPGSGGVDPGGEGDLKDCYTVRFDIHGYRARCSQARNRSCRCLKAETLAGGCSSAKAVRDHRTGAWIVTISAQDAQVVEGFSTCGSASASRCNTGTLVNANMMKFTRERARRHHPQHAIEQIELTYCVPRRTP